MDKQGAMSTKSQPIIVIKKKGGHGGHHGGAWKVAYADFVTAMMALFIVLWLMGSSEKVKKAVAGYFQDPKGTGEMLGTTMSGTGDAVTVSGAADLNKLKDKLEQQIQSKKELDKLSKQVEITVTSEGLRIELLEGKSATFFESGSAHLSPSGQELLTLLAGELKTLPNSLLIEGHTDAAQYSTNGDYSNWELSADRANAARRLMQQDGVRQDQVTQVRGYADQMLRVKNNPYDPSNRRISILVKNADPGVLPKLKDAKDASGGPAAAPAANEAPRGKEAAGGKEAPGANKPAAPAQNQKAATPPPAAAKPAPAAAKPGLLGKLTGMLPGKKK